MNAQATSSSSGRLAVMMRKVREKLLAKPFSVGAGGQSSTLQGVEAGHSKLPPAVILEALSAYAEEKAVDRRVMQIITEPKA